MGASASSSVTSKLTNDGENHRVKYASSTMRGYCVTMQDALAVELDLDALRNTSFVGVYDGDGGAEVAMYCAKRFHAMLCEDENYLNNLPNAITSVCSRLDVDLQRSNEWRESLYPRGAAMAAGLADGMSPPSARLYHGRSLAAASPFLHHNEHTRRRDHHQHVQHDRSKHRTVTILKKGEKRASLESSN